MQNTKNPVAKLNHFHLDKMIELLAVKNDTELAPLLGCSISLISRLRSGQRTFSPQMCARVKFLTRGEITGYVMRPDIYN